MPSKNKSQALKILLDCKTYYTPFLARIHRYTLTLARRMDIMATTIHAIVLQVKCNDNRSWFGSVFIYFRMLNINYSSN